MPETYVSNYPREPFDLYSTPPDLLSALTNTIQIQTPIWEPAAGSFALSNHLETTLGELVYTSDIQDERPIDFLQSSLPSPDIRSIVTNPPFKLLDNFILHLLNDKITFPVPNPPPKEDPKPVPIPPIQQKLLDLTTSLNTLLIQNPEYLLHLQNNHLSITKKLEGPSNA